jgi:Zn-dependent protease
MDELSLIGRIVVWSLPVVLAITGHEVAHGWMAKKFGDKTADQQGRLTLNPLKHIDLFGTIILPCLLLITFTGFIFGWAKPVPVDARNFKNPKKAMMMVALAGPVANLCMATIWALIGRIGVAFYQIAFIYEPFVQWSRAGITINLVLAFVNLLPIPPLDGSRVIAGLLPDYWAWQYNRLERYGLLLLLALFVGESMGYFSIISSILNYPMYYAQQLFFSLAGR